MYRYYPYRNNYLNRNSNISSPIRPLNGCPPNSIPPPKPPSPPPVPIPPPPKPKSPHKKAPKKKFDFKSFKKDTCKSLDEVEHFLCDFNKVIKFIKLYNLLK